MTVKKSILLITFAVIVSVSAKAQFIKGFGIVGGLTYANQKWFFDSADGTKINQKYKLGWNGAIFMEYLDRDYVRIVTEIEYNRKGAIEKYPIPDQRDRANYVSLNNFLKFRQELYDVTPYFYVGPKVEYFLNSQPLMKQLHASAAAGVGIEFLYKDPWIPFVEFQWNPDVMKAADIPEWYRIKNNAFLLRVGLKYQRLKRSTCPAYMDPS
jgi:hypothetical protein